MAVLYITEFAGISQDGLGQLAPVGKMPPLAEQTVAIGGASAQSAAFSGNTGLIRVAADAPCSISIGANPTATATTMRLPANGVEYFAVQPGRGYKVAVITNT